jgi:APA family basic amino acid/polyamine antiporter
MYGVGIILGAGIYALVGEAAGVAGNAVWMSFVIGAVVSIFTGLSYAELSAMYPKTAAEYVYVRKAYGNRFLAFLIGWLILFTGIASAATVALGFAGYFKSMFSHPTMLVAVILLALLSYVNFIGIKESSKFNILFTFIEIIGLIIVIVLGIGSFGKANLLDAPNGFKGVVTATSLIFFAYIGFEEIVSLAEETKNPKRNIPMALMTSIPIITTLYILVSLAAVSLVDWQVLGKAEAPLALAVSSVLGSTGSTVISFIALFSTMSTVLIILIVTSRMIYGMSHDRALPKFLSLVHKKRKTPWVAIIVTMMLSILFMLIGKIDTLASITSMGAFISFAVVNLSLIWLRISKPKLHRPFRVPLNIGNFPVLSFLGLLFCMFMILQFDYGLLMMGLVIVIAGAAVYKIRKEKIVGDVEDSVLKELDHIQKETIDKY